MWQARSGKQGAAVATGSKRDSKERGAARAATQGLLRGYLCQRKAAAVIVDWILGGEEELVLAAHL